MNTKRFGFAGILAAFALAVSTLVAPSANAATEIVVWADESRGPNLAKVIAAKGDWVTGYTVKVVSFSSFDALKEALDKATDASGPDIVVGANDWVPTAAKSGKLAPITLTAAVKARFNPTQFLDLTYKGKLYGVPVDINNVAMIYNTKLVSSAPKNFGEMVSTYKSLKASKGLKAGLCIAGGGMSWGGLSGFSALGAEPYLMNADGTVNYNKSFDPAVFAKNVSTLLLDKKGKSNGFWPATDTGCQDNFLAGKVPFAIIGNWHWRTFAEAGFDMNIQPVPGVKPGTYGKMFGSVSGAFLTSYAEAHGVAVPAKSLLTSFFASTKGQVAYQAEEGRPPAEKGAQKSQLVLGGQKAMGAAASLSSIPQIGAFLNTNAGGANYWDSAPAYWNAVLVDGKNPLTEAKKLAAIWKANVAAGKADL